MPKIIKVEPQGRMGNQMMQYMVADNLRKLHPTATITGFGKSPHCNNILKWGIDFQQDSAEPELSFPLSGHMIDLPAASRFLSETEDGMVVLKNVSCRFSYYKDHLESYRRIFSPQTAEVEGFGPESIVINVRLGDALAGIHPLYPVLPISWYEHVVRTTGLAPVFIGQFGNDPFTRALHERFPAARFYSNADPIVDFQMLRASSQIILPVSTFSWLAAWLSETVTSIHYPIAGLYDRRHRRDVDLFPIDDKRYKFYLFPLEKWTGSPDDVRGAIENPKSFDEISQTDALTLLGPNLPDWAELRGI